MNSTISKRDLLKGIGAVGVLGPAFGLASCNDQVNSDDKGPAAALASMTEHAEAISTSERQARIAKAQQLMRESGIGALVVEPGASLVYFTGIRWWRSERFTGVIIPAEGDFAIVTPYFEEPSIREQMLFGDDVRTWHEHESPFALIAQFLNERKLLSKPVAIEESVRQFIGEGLTEANSEIGIVSGKAVVRGCRMIKSESELRLMQIANDVTLAAYRHIYPQVEIGMTRQDISAMMSAATSQLGGRVKFSMCLIGPASAYPHGTRQEHKVNEGSIVLMDCGCSVLDYQSDISRTWVVGEATKKQRDIWKTVRRGQEVALETAQIGTEVGRVDDEVRKYYESLGFGPDYAAPGLTHRVGHGIGMDGHEPVNFVRGEKTRLEPGMCFSNEPGIYVPGEFGVRLEDCLYMTDSGARLFTPLSESIENPMNL